jgi:Tfp pilus assembly PilM family ATPase
MARSSFLSRLTKPLRAVLPGGGTDAVVALDVTPDAVRALHVRRDGTDVVLDRFRVLHLASGRRRLTYDDALAQALELRLGDEPVAVALSSPDAVIRRLELPSMNTAELHEALPWEARRQIAGLADDALLDAQVLEQERRDGPTEGVLVAFPGKLYEEVRASWQSLGIEPAFVDVGPLAAMNACLLGRAGRETGDVAALLALGNAIASFSIFSAQSLILFRDLAMRLSHVDQLLGTALALDPDHVATLKSAGKASANQPDSAAIAKALGEVLGELAEDLRAARLYLENRGGGTLERVFWTGAEAAFLDRHGLIETLATQSGVKLERLQPFHGMRIGLLDEMGLKAVTAELAAAAGVAARFFAAAN